MHARMASDPSHTLSPRSSLQLTSSALNSERHHPSWCQTLPQPSPLIFKKAVDHTCSCSILECGNHDEGNGTECDICLGAVMLRFYGNTPPSVTVTLLSFLSVPAILRNRLCPVKRANRSRVRKAALAQGFHVCT